MKILEKFSKLLFETCQNFQEEHKLTVHKVVIEDNQITFEIWSVGDKDNNIHIKTYNYTNNRKKKK